MCLKIKTEVVNFPFEYNVYFCKLFELTFLHKQYIQNELTFLHEQYILNVSSLFNFEGDLYVQFV